MAQFDKNYIRRSPSQCSTSFDDVFRDFLPLDNEKVYFSQATRGPWIKQSIIIGLHGK